jgi:hypothetical protein
VNTPRVDAIPRRGPFHHYVVDDVLAVARELERELTKIGEYLWPEQTGMPNEHRDILTAIQARDKLLRAQYEGALIREALCREIIAKMDESTCPVEEALARMVESFSDSRCSCHEEEEGDTCYRCLARGSAMEAATKALK